MKLVSIIEYGFGNIRSVFNAFNAIREKKNIKVLVTSEEKEIKWANSLVLPGVGSFDPSMINLGKTVLIPSIIEWINDGKLKILTDELDGLNQAPKGFVDLLAGGNIGTRVVNVS